MGVIWEPTLFQIHMTCRVLFEDGFMSEPSRILEGIPLHEIKGSLMFEAPGYPAVLVIGFSALEYLDCMYPGRCKEAAAEDPFGRPCVEVTAPNALAVDGIQPVMFAAPVFNTPHGGLLEALAKRRLA